MPPSEKETDALGHRPQVLREDRHQRHPCSKLVPVSPNRPPDLDLGTRTRKNRAVDGLRVVVIGIEDLLLDRLRAWVHWHAARIKLGSVALLYADRIDWQYLRSKGVARCPRAARRGGRPLIDYEEFQAEVRRRKRERWAKISNRNGPGVQPVETSARPRKGTTADEARPRPAGNGRIPSCFGQRRDVDALRQGLLRPLLQESRHAGVQSARSSTPRRLRRGLSPPYGGPRTSIIDVGCGLGRLLSTLGEAFPKRVR